MNHDYSETVDLTGFEDSMLAYSRFVEDGLSPLEAAYRRTSSYTLSMLYDLREYIHNGGTKRFPSQRDRMIAEGFTAGEVDAFLAEKQAKVDEALRRNNTRRARTRRWVRARRERLALAVDVLRGDHECGDY